MFKKTIYYSGDKKHIEKNYYLFGVRIYQVRIDIEAIQRALTAPL